DQQDLRPIRAELTGYVVLVRSTEHDGVENREGDVGKKAEADPLDGGLRPETVKAQAADRLAEVDAARQVVGKKQRDDEKTNPGAELDQRLGTPAQLVEVVASAGRPAARQG